MNKEEQTSFELEQEELARQEAGMIGGLAGDENLDPAMRPLLQSGQGESEGWELAEHDLILHSTHGDDESDLIILHRVFEQEQEENNATYSEADSWHWRSLEE